MCTKRAPKCGECPLAVECGWRAVGCVAPDPVEKSAGTPKRQSVFTGSDRQGRGRLVTALRLGPVSSEPAALATTMGWTGDSERSMRVAMSLVADGLVKWEQASGTFHLR